MKCKKTLVTMTALVALGFVAYRACRYLDSLLDDLPDGLDMGSVDD